MLVSGSVAHKGTGSTNGPNRYGITKAAFHRLYQQLNAEDMGIPVASLSPGQKERDGKGVMKHHQKGGIVVNIQTLETGC